MGWSIGFDSDWQRDIGYGVPCLCDHPECDKRIDRGLSYVCGSEPRGGDRGCGLYFCESHLFIHGRHSLCSRCKARRKPFDAKPDTDEWVRWKLSDESWAKWRAENEVWVREQSVRLEGIKT